jgi:hypothetical protein
MATKDQLYTRIILDTDRDDMGSSGALEQAKIDAVADAIEFHSDEQFWFNRASGSGNTTADVATIALPSGVRVPGVVAYNGAALERVPLASIEHLTTTGIPAKWAENEDAIQLYPIPDGVYAISVYGLADVGVPAAGGDSNIWTTDAVRLIHATALKILYQGPLRDLEWGALWAGNEIRELARLRRETRRRGSSPLTADMPVPTGFDIVTG